MDNNKRHFTAQQKVKILREHLIDKVPVSQLCQKHQIQPTLLYAWQKSFFENGTAAFERQWSRSRVSVEQKKLEQLEAKLQRKDEVLAELMTEHIMLKKFWGDLKRKWVEHDVRDEIVEFMKRWAKRTELPIRRLVRTAGLGLSKFYNWKDRYGLANEHNAPVPRDPAVAGLVAVTHHAGSWTNGTFYAHHNHRGDIVVTRTGTTTVGTYDYSAFGNLKSQIGSDVCRFKFSSKELDRATGFYYYGYRFYAPQWQRWINRDPFGDPTFDQIFWLLTLLRPELRRAPGVLFTDQNRYAFGFNDPIGSVDPDGLGIRDLCNLCLVTPAMLDAIQAYRDAVNRLNSKYGEGNWPPDIEEYMDRWQRDLAQQFGPCVMQPITKSMPGTSVTGPVVKPRPRPK